MNIVLSASDLVGPLAHDLRTPGVAPVPAVERALEEYLFEKFRDGLGEMLVKAPRVRVHAGYFKNRFANLVDLAQSGYETWYVEVHFACQNLILLQDLQIRTEEISFVPLSYGGGISRAVDLTTRHLKKQINHAYRINHLRLPGDFFQALSRELLSGGELSQPRLSNFHPGPDIRGFRTVSFDHVLTGARKFCRCSMAFHSSILADAQARAPSFAPNSWPHAVIAMLGHADYEDAICHLCLVRNGNSEDAVRRYGAAIIDSHEAYTDQVKFDLNADARTAREEVKRLMGLSRWTREATIYGVVSDLFPDQLVLREASPEWLGRLRLDIYLPGLKLAIEHQGQQHYEPVAIFGGEKAHAAVLERDILKRTRCEQSGVTIIYIRYDAPITKAAIRDRLRSFLIT